MKDCRIATREFVKSLLKKFIFRTEYFYIDYEASPEHSDTIYNSEVNNMLKYWNKYNIIKTNMEMNSDSFVLLKKGHRYLIEYSILNSVANMSHYTIDINNNPLAGTPRGCSSLETWSPYISKFIYTPEKDTYIGLRAASTVLGSSVIWSHCSNFHILSFPKYIMRLK